MSYRPTEHSNRVEGPGLTLEGQGWRRRRRTTATSTCCLSSVQSLCWTFRGFLFSPHNYASKPGARFTDEETETQGCKMAFPVLPRSA